MSKDSTADLQLNVLAVRGTGFPEECLQAFPENDLFLTQAPDTFAARAAQGGPSCIAIGPAWSLEERYLHQVMQQAPEGAVLLSPEGDVKLAHLAGLLRFAALESYSDGRLVAHSPAGALGLGGRCGGAAGVACGCRAAEHCSTWTA